VAADASAFTFDLAKGADLLVVDVTARPETSAAQLEEEVEREIDHLHRDGVAEVEVRRATSLIETDLTVSLQSAGERADRLSMFATYFGEPGLINEQADRYRAVTAEQVNEIISERFGEDKQSQSQSMCREKGSNQNVFSPPPAQDDGYISSSKAGTGAQLPISPIQG